MTISAPAEYIGLDVGKSDHHAVAVTATGETVYDTALANDETRLRATLYDLVEAHGPVLLVVDQPATIGALPVAVAQSCEGVEAAYLPGLATLRIADLHPGSAKTHARDAAIVAEAARTIPPPDHDCDWGEGTIMLRSSWPTPAHSGLSGCRR